MVKFHSKWPVLLYIKCYVDNTFVLGVLIFHVSETMLQDVMSGNVRFKGRVANREKKCQIGYHYVEHEEDEGIEILF